jgi:hypothetical protein
VDSHEPAIVHERGDHGDADEEHGEQEGGHEPVEDAGEEKELGARRGVHGCFATSCGETAALVLASPSRRL